MNRQRFTLVELLTVIVIIMILIGILLPAVRAVIVQAEVRATEARIHSLELAISQYETVYFVLPSIAGIVSGAEADTSPDNDGDVTITEDSDAYEQFISLLTNATVGTNGLGNVRGIRFLNPADATNPLSYDDKWGQPFRIKVDSSYNGEIDGSSLPGIADGSKLYLSYAIVSAGPDETFATDADNVASW